VMDQQRQALGMPFDWHLPGVKTQTTVFPPAAHWRGSAALQGQPGDKMYPPPRRVAHPSPTSGNHEPA